MNIFKDNRGRSWRVAIDGAAIDRLAKLAGFDLFSSAENEALATRAESEPAVVIDLLHAVCFPQLEAAGISSRQFRRAISGRAALADALTALGRAMVAFADSIQQPSEA
jgi:hypothetical protein